MRKIFVAIVIIFIIFLVLIISFFILRGSFSRFCTLGTCSEGVIIITNTKFSDGISVVADGQVLLDLCEFSKEKRSEILNSSYGYGHYLFSDRPDDLKPRLYVAKNDPHKVKVWQIMTQPNCGGSTQLLHEIKDKDMVIKETEPRGPGCGTCQNGIIDLSS